MVKSESRKLCKRIISMAEITVEVHPGMARSVNVFIPTKARITNREILIRDNEKISSRLAMISINTAIAPRPCIKRELKFMEDLPAYLLPRLVTMDIYGKPVLMIPPAIWFTSVIIMP